MDIQKKDLCYMNLILVIILIFLIIIMVTDLANLNSRLSLVSTITSIILSVIAIIYTLLESQKSNIVKSELFKSAQKISTITVDINNSVEKLTEITDDFDDISYIIKELSHVKDIVVGVDKQNTDIYTKMNELSNFIPKRKTIVEDDTINIETFVDDFLEDDFYFRTVCILYYALEHEEDYFDILAKFYHPSKEVLKIGIVVGTIFVLSDLQLVSFLEKRKIEKLNKTLLIKFKENEKFKVMYTAISNKVSNKKGSIKEENLTTNK